MARLTPTEAAEKMVRRVTAATEDINRGIDRVQISPMEQAADQQELMIQHLIEAVQSGKWAEGLRSVSLAEWKTLFKTKGVPRIAPGIRAAQPKIEAFFREFLPFQDQITAETRAMPKGSLDDRIARATHQMRRTADYRR